MLTTNSLFENEEVYMLTVELMISVAEDKACIFSEYRI